MISQIDRIKKNDGLASGVRDAPAIEFSGASVELGGRVILQSVDLSVKQGEFVCVIGPSGCGKTTLLRLIAGLVKPSRGEVRVAGQTVISAPADVAVVFQDYGRALLPWRTASGNISFALEAVGVNRSERRPIVQELLGKLGLGQHGHKYPRELSGGMQQRLQIARCLAQRPSILLMDEPFGSLDAMTRQKLQDEVLRMAKQLSMTMFFVTHDLDEALYVGTRVVALRGNPGQVAQTFDVPLPFPRDQFATREHPEFLHLRRALHSAMGEGG